MKNRYCGIILILFTFILTIPLAVRAQSSASVKLSSPIIESFPNISAYLRTKDIQGNFIHNLSADQIEINENDVLLPLSSLEEMRNGVQFAVVLNPGASFGIRNSQAISRYDIIKDALRNWANSRQGSTIDDLSLLITEGAEISHVSNPEDWLKTLAMDQVDARIATPRLDALFKSITIVSDPTPRPGMGRAILFITPPLEGQDDLSIENILAQTANVEKQEKVPIFIWMVTTAGAYSAQSLGFLEQIANQTGGKLFIYTDEAPLPDPEDILEPLRYTYRLSYQSRIKQSGEHQIKAVTNLAGAQVESNSQNFSLDIQPPEPAFISPPLTIQRILNPPEQQGERQNQFEADNSTEEYPIQVIFDFPDGRKRDIVQSTLLVNGEIVSNNTEPPFDKFIWDLRDYQSNDLHILQVQATDILGLTGASIEIPVEIFISQSENTNWEKFNNAPVLIAAAIVTAIALLFLVLVVGKRLAPSTSRFPIRHHQKTRSITEEIRLRSKSPTNRIPEWASRLMWEQKRNPPDAEAMLVPIANSGSDYSFIPIQLSSDSITLGSDPKQSTIAFHDASIAPKHTLITRVSYGTYQIVDLDSIAGTWVNYLPVQKEAVKLEHGDQVHIGRIGFIFTLRDRNLRRKPIIQPPPVVGESSA